ncbi:MAG: hypothetical protein K9W44_14190 [Candidatus Lokiarchaeota archaeon]|nr:hypothetical protein [Candidatus Harpocratesius repetitus]
MKIDDIINENGIHNQDKIKKMENLENQIVKEEYNKENHSILKKQSKIFKKVRHWAIRLSLFLTEIWILLPIIFGIIIPMVYMIPLAYSSWILFFNNSNGPLGEWVNRWFNIDYSSSTYIILLIVELMIFILGLFLICTSIYRLAKDRRYNHQLTTSGIYNFIRHPQNLGLILITLSLSLDVPIVDYSQDLVLFGQYIYQDIGIRFGEILSWTLFSVILVIISLFEERKMMKKYPQEYLAYQCTTGFFFPLLLRKNIKNAQKPKRIHYKNDKQLFFIIFLIFCGYIVFLFAMYFLSLYLAEHHLLIMTD